MKEFQRIFMEEMATTAKNKLRLNPCNNMKIIQGKSFKKVESADTMLEEGR